MAGRFFGEMLGGLLPDWNVIPGGILSFYPSFLLINRSIFDILFVHLLNIYIFLLFLFIHFFPRICIGRNGCFSVCRYWYILSCFDYVGSYWRYQIPRSRTCKYSTTMMMMMMMIEYNNPPYCFRILGY